MESSNVDLLKTFFKYYINSVLRENEKLNTSYIEKLKGHYSKM